MNKYNCPTKHQRGITLLDLLVTLSIAAILSTTAFSGLAKLKTRFELMADKNSLLTLVKSARQTAITNNSYTTICHLENNACNDFLSPLSAFTDNNKNQILDVNEKLIGIVETSNNTNLSWNRNNRIRFEASGRAGGFNGTLLYCLNDKGFSLVISRIGRMRITTNEKCN